MGSRQQCHRWNTRRWSIKHNIVCSFYRIFVLEKTSVSLWKKFPSSDSLKRGGSHRYFGGCKQAVSIRTSAPCLKNWVEKLEMSLIFTMKEKNYLYSLGNFSIRSTLSALCFFFFSLSLSIYPSLSLFLLYLLSFSSLPLLFFLSLPFPLSLSFSSPSPFRSPISFFLFLTFSLSTDHQPGHIPTDVSSTGHTNTTKQWNTGQHWADTQLWLNCDRSTTGHVNHMKF